MLFDAHNHIHDTRLDPCRADFLAELPALGVTGAVVNGTREGDWDAVAALAESTPWVLPSFGLHPWYVNERGEHWREKLLTHLSGRCGVGEIGLDRWIHGHDTAAQAEVFLWQLGIAAERDLPATIHCVRAWDAMWDVLRDHPVPARGFLLHACAAPIAMARRLASRGAYFSFSPHFLHERKGAQRELFAQLPIERLLVETDAPDLAPPPELDARGLRDADGRQLSHPANLLVAYRGLAEIRGMEHEALAERIAINFARFVA